MAQSLDIAGGIEKGISLSPKMVIVSGGGEEKVNTHTLTECIKNLLYITHVRGSIEF
jgi:hypothetical protein